MDLFFEDTPVCDEVCRRKVEHDEIEAVRNAVARDIAARTECFVAREGVVMRMHLGEIKQLMH